LACLDSLILLSVTIKLASSQNELAAEFKPFSNRDKDLVIQFTVKHEQNID
jgi:hypothetical protein